MTALSHAAAAAGGFVAATPAELVRGQNQNPGVTPLQGRVVFHQERLLRSTGAGVYAHQHYTQACHRAGLPVAIAQFSVDQCRVALQLLEAACRVVGMSNFRDVRTGWESLA